MKKITQKSQLLKSDPSSNQSAPRSLPQMSFKNSFALLAVALLGFSTACTKQESVVERQAPADITQSFTVSGNTLTLQRSSLDKRFLLMSSGTSGGPTPQWVDVKPQVVSFTLDKAGKKLALNEENYNIVYDEIRSVNLLATFKVVSSDENSVSFDWGQGLTSLTVEDVFATDVSDPADKADEDSARIVMPIIDSYVSAIQFDAANNLEINQISKIRTTSLKGEATKPELQTREETINLNLQIRPYLPREGFLPKLADAQRRVGFFVTKRAELTKSASQRNYITRWDIDPSRGPITFMIPQSVPVEYVQAAAEGALYWNKVFGREVIVVQKDVDTHETPKARAIMLHWVPWLDAGAAYAQAQADPLTGEILRAQIFMPSAFTRIGSADQINLNGGNPVRNHNGSLPHSAAVLSPLLNPIKACDFNLRRIATDKLASEATDSQRLRLAQDSVRSTIAHEMGHTLGLRHNFAGSFSAKVTTAQILDSASTYLKDLNHQGLEATTSIMDYVSGVDDVLTSAYIKHEGLSYDKMAMNWAYAEKDGNSRLSENVSLYCSDEDIGLANAKGFNIYGCERFDAGNNPLERKFLDTRSSKQDFVKSLFVSIIGRLYPEREDDRADLASVLSDTARFGLFKTEGLEFISPLIFDYTIAGTKKTKFISFENAKSHVGTEYASSDPYLDAKVGQDLKAAGGYASLLKGLLRDQTGAVEVNWFENEIAALKAAPYFVKGQTLGGRSYVLSNADQDAIVGFLNQYALGNTRVVYAGATKLMPLFADAANKRNLKTGLLQDGEVASLAVLASDLEQAKTGAEVVKVGIGLTQTLEVPTKFYTGLERAIAMNLLSPELMGTTGNGLASKVAVAQGIREELNRVILAADPLAIPAGKLQSVTKDEYLLIIGTLMQKRALDEKALNYLSQELIVFAALF